MPTVAVYDIANQQVGDIELNENIFGVEVNAGLLHQAVVMQLASQRLGNHATKTRGMVRGGGRKPWYRIRSISTLLLLQHASQAASPCTQVRPV